MQVAAVALGATTTKSTKVPMIQHQGMLLVTRPDDKVKVPSYALVPPTKAQAEKPLITSIPLMVRHDAQVNAPSMAFASHVVKPGIPLGTIKPLTIGPNEKVKAPSPMVTPAVNAPSLSSTTPFDYPDIDGNMTLPEGIYLVESDENAFDNDTILINSMAQPVHAVDPILGDPIEVKPATRTVLKMGDPNILGDPVNVKGSTAKKQVTKVKKTTTPKRAKTTRTPRSTTTRSKTTRTTRAKTTKTTKATNAKLQKKTTSTTTVQH